MTTNLGDWRTSRARVAALSRSRDAQDPELRDARCALRADRLAEQIRAAVEAAPPLSDEQRERLAALLRPVGGDAA